MREQELFRIIQQCDDQKVSIKRFIKELNNLRKGTDQVNEKLKYKMQIIKYRKRNSALSTRVLHARHRLVMKGHNIKIE